MFGVDQGALEEREDKYSIHHKTKSKIDTGNFKIKITIKIKTLYLDIGHCFFTSPSVFNPTLFHHFQSLKMLKIKTLFKSRETLFITVL